jgi:DNA-directed RNA polymerase sigma subunit (sigma70/sigma32)
MEKWIKGMLGMVVDNRKARVNYSIDPIEALDLLPDPRLKQVLELRLGLNGNKKHTLKEITTLIENRIYKDKFVSIQTVRCIEAKALRYLQHPKRNCTVTFNIGIVW